MFEIYELVKEMGRGKAFVRFFSLLCSIIPEEQACRRTGEHGHEEKCSTWHFLSAFS